MPKEVIVTKQWLTNYIQTQPRDKVEKMIGRALVALFKRQTDDEKTCNDTKQSNGIGFNSADGRSGSLTAKAYKRHGKLLDWQLAKWTKPTGKYNQPRIVKYHKQLNEIAIEREENVIRKLQGKPTVEVTG